MRIYYKCLRYDHVKFNRNKSYRQYGTKIVNHSRSNITHIMIEIVIHVFERKKILYYLLLYFLVNVSVIR